MTNLIQFISQEFQTIALAVLLLLSLVLPLMAGSRNGAQAAERRTWARLAWAGQILMASCGLLVIVVPRFSPIGFVMAVVVCALFARKLRRQMRPAPTKG